MRRGIFIFLGIAVLAFCVISAGCRARVDKDSAESTTAGMEEEVVAPMTEEEAGVTTTEPAGATVVENIPPTASAPTPPAKPVVSVTRIGSEKDIQTALKNAGFYEGAVDGKVGPKTRKAIEDFQRAKGLKVDGKVGPKTWAELERYLAR